MRRSEPYFGFVDVEKAFRKSSAMCQVVVRCSDGVRDITHEAKVKAMTCKAKAKAMIHKAKAKAKDLTCHAALKPQTLYTVQC